MNLLNIILISLVSCAALAAPFDKIVLTEKNMVILDSDVSDSSAAYVSVALIKQSRRLDKGEPIYLVLNTTGGSIAAGMRIVETALSLPRKVKTISVKAASMGFFIAQFLDTRYITPTGYMMTHEPTTTVRGRIRSSLITGLKNELMYIDYIERRVATRMKISIDVYQTMADMETYLNGASAVKAGAADEMIVVVCARSLGDKCPINPKIFVD